MSAQFLPLPSSLNWPECPVRAECVFLVWVGPTRSTQEAMGGHESGWFLPGWAWCCHHTIAARPLLHHISWWAVWGFKGWIIFIHGQELWESALLLSVHGGHAYIHVSMQEHTEEQHKHRGVERDSPEIGDLRRGNESIIWESMYICRASEGTHLTQVCK